MLREGLHFFLWGSKQTSSSKWPHGTSILAPATELPTEMPATHAAMCPGVQENTHPSLLNFDHADPGIQVSYWEKCSLRWRIPCQHQQAC